MASDRERAALGEETEPEVHASRGTALATGATGATADELLGLGDALLVMDAEFRIVRVNEQQEALSRKTRAETLGRVFWDVWPETVGQSRYWTEYQRCMQARVPVRFEEYFEPLGLWAEVTAKPTSDGGMVVFFRDVTAQRTAESALRDSEARYRQLVEQAGDAVTLVDREGRIREANARTCESLGFTREELIGRSIADVDQAYDPREADRIWAPMRPGEVTTFQRHHSRKDGSTFPVEVRLGLVRVQGELLMLGLARDVRERAAAEAARRRLEEAVEQTPLRVVLTDADARVLYVNPCFERTSGFARAEALGAHARTLGVGADDSPLEALIGPTLARGEAWSGRLRSRAKDGRAFVEEAVVSAVRDARGDAVGIVSVSRDVTGELAIQERLSQSQRLESVGRLAGGVAHDFNNLLTVVLSSTAILRDALERGEPPDVEEVEALEAAGRRASELTSQLLAFARKQVLAPTRLDLNTVIEGAERLLRRVIGEDVELLVELDPELWPVFCDRAQLDQIVMNLAVNARDAMPEGGTLKLSTRNEADVGEPPRDWVVLEVTDSGCGMTAEVLARIFDPFFTTKPHGRGTGVGLSTVFGIVHQHEGEIAARSEVGRGTTFEVRLPRYDGDEPSPSSERRPRAEHRGDETILIVEDDADLRAAVARMLRRAGYAAWSAEDGRAALRLLDEGLRPALLLSDVVMPGMNGYALAREARARVPDLALLFMSGYAPEIAEPRELPLGPENRLRKPFVRSELFARVRMLLDLRAGGVEG
jgi:PAS domain S-box-containing protein